MKLITWYKFQIIFILFIYWLLFSYQQNLITSPSSQSLAINPQANMNLIWVVSNNGIVMLVLNEWENEWMNELTVDGWEDGQYILWIEQIVYFMNTNLLERSVLLMIANGVVHSWLFWIFIIIFFYFKFNFSFQ